MSAIWGWAHDAGQPEKCMRTMPSPLLWPFAPFQSAPSSCVEEPGPLEGAGLRLDHGEATELAPRAGGRAPRERSGAGAVDPEQRLGQQIVQAILGDTG